MLYDTSITKNTKLNIYSIHTLHSIDANNEHKHYIRKGLFSSFKHIRYIFYILQKMYVHTCYVYNIQVLKPVSIIQTRVADLYINFFFRQLIKLLILSSLLHVHVSSIKLSCFNLTVLYNIIQNKRQAIENENFFFHFISFTSLFYINSSVCTVYCVYLLYKQKGRNSTCLAFNINFFFLQYAI